MKSIFVFLACIIVALTPFVFPGVPYFPTLLQFAGTAFIAFFTLRNVAGTSAAAEYILLGAWTLISVGIIINVWYYTTYSGGSITQPVLVNTDAACAWERIQARLSGTTVGHAPLYLYGFSAMMAFFAWPGPAEISSLLVANELFTLLAIIFTGGLTRRLSGADAPKGVVPASMLMIAMVSYFLQTGTILIKDAAVCAVMAAALYAIAGMMVRLRLSDCLLLAAAILLGALLRPNLMPLLAGGLALSAIMMKRGSIAVVATGAVICVGLYVVNRMAATAPQVIGDQGSSLVMISSHQDRLLAYNSVMGNYEDQNFWRMLLRLPVSLGLQYITPLPWAFARDSVFGPAASWAHFSFPWYALGGLILYCVFFMFRQLPRRIAFMLFYGVALWIVTAYMTGGTISRYCLPWLPALVPAAAWAWQNGCRHRRSFRIWYGCYCAAMVLVLSAAFILLHHYTPGGWSAV